MKRTTLTDLLRLKTAGTRFAMLTAHDATVARLLDGVVPLILVGDSLGNVFAGHSTTLPVTIEQMIYHTEIVSRETRQAMVVADMPFLSYQISIESAKKNAGALIQKGGAQAVKLEINAATLDTAKAIVDMGIPVMGHLGLTPQSVHQLSGFRRQATSPDAAKALLQLATSLESIGCFAIVLEMIGDDLAKIVTDTVHVPTIGIGAGRHCDAQVLVTSDLLGWSDKKTPSFVTPYATLFNDAQTAVSQFVSDVEKNKFPH